MLATRLVKFWNKIELEKINATVTSALIRAPQNAVWQETITQEIKATVKDRSGIAWIVGAKS
jgi:hypothetical protein